MHRNVRGAITVGERYALLRAFALAAETFDDEADVATVVVPDHPFLTVGPDLLVARNGHLVAAFLPTAAEMRRSDDLAARVAISRLALQPSTFTVLIDDRLNAPAQNGGRFDAVLRSNGLGDFGGICANPHRATAIINNSSAAPCPAPAGSRSSARTPHRQVRPPESA